MDLSTSAKLIDEQASVESSLEDLLTKHDISQLSPSAFLGAQFDAGLAWVHFPVGSGGLGVSPSLQSVVDERLRQVGAPSPWANFQGIAQGAAAINAAGTEWQRKRFLRPAFTNEEMWSQLFSEPGAGSDLASLATRAERDGEEWVVNGQKVWTSGAEASRWAILVARSNPDVPKHRGLTCFVCDMRADGIEVRPIRQADGAAHFNEVFLTDVRLSDSLRVGEEGHGWTVSMAGLDSERRGVATLGALGPDRDTMLRMWRNFSEKDSPVGRSLRDRVARTWIDFEILRLTNMMAGARRDDAGVADPAGPLGKLRRTGVNVSVTNLLVTLMGPEGMLGGEYAWDLDGRDRPIQLEAIRARANTIEGGTSEIMKNVIGERVLGLPPDIRVDKTVPWSDIPRN
jgi:alkylation response protein AidB-like acyl-CoA dehydrogenase